MKNIIILSAEIDQHVHPVVEQIKLMGGCPVILDIKENGEKFSVVVDSGGINIVNGNKDTMSFEDVSSIWYRRPVFKSGGDDVSVPWQKEFAEGEERETWDGIWLSLREKVFFLNHPFLNRVAGNKIFQLNFARNMGFQIPNFLVTNSPNDVAAFVEKHKRVIYKVLHQPKKKGKTIDDFHVFFTNIVEEKHLQDLSQITIAPCLFQEYIEKVYEVRVTVVGDQIFAEKIFSQNSSVTEIDWRRDPTLLRHEIETLPKDISDKCLGLVKNLGLSFGAIDLIFNKKLGYIFLEINPNGQWLWIERILGLPISKSIASVLVKGHRSS
ncbi:MAG: hypothetical protein WC229_03285 [Candidatus Paceibacterota bacterium]|jgi:glutathione synthase/RimK-type ligase-like ATP-grasp enzyme